MSPEESELIGRVIKNNEDNAAQLQRAMEGQKTLFKQLVKMEDEKNHWKRRAEKAEAEVRKLLNKQNRPDYDATDTRD